MLNLYYRNGALYVEVLDKSPDIVSIMERRIFKIIEDYGIDKIVIYSNGLNNMGLLNDFKRNYYHRFNGYLLIR